MKTEAQIQAKIKEHEDRINELEIIEENIDIISELLACRDLAKWELDENPNDEFSKKIKFELMCLESTKIF